MSVKGEILSINLYDERTDGLKEVGMSKFIKQLRSLLTSEDEIEERVRESSKYHENKLIEMGLSEEEATQKIEELITQSYALAEGETNAGNDGE
jgi:hypothetical protein